MSELVLDVSLANEMKNSFLHNGWTESTIRKAMQGHFLRSAKRILSGEAQIVEKSPTLQLDQPPMTPIGWRVESHDHTGIVEWKASSLLFHPIGTEESWDAVMESVRFSFALNANALDFLLENPWLIPDDCPDHVFFLGTKYRTEKDLEAVRYMVRTDIGWVWRPCIFEDDPEPFGHAALIYTGC